MATFSSLVRPTRAMRIFRPIGLRAAASTAAASIQQIPPHSDPLQTNDAEAGPSRPNRTTHFGFREVPESEKESLGLSVPILAMAI